MSAWPGIKSSRSTRFAMTTWLFCTLGGRGTWRMLAETRNLLAENDIRILAASQANDVALESEKLKQGLLTYALVHDGLEAKQAVVTGTKEITLDSWLQY